MTERRLEERLEIPNGIRTEWEPSTDLNLDYVSAQDAAKLIREANAKAKREGSYVRYRSVPVEDIFA